MRTTRMPLAVVLLFLAVLSLIAAIIILAVLILVVFKWKQRIQIKSYD
jgi:hypothetical protein